MALKSRYGGSLCPNCNQPIQIGEMIDKRKGQTKWGHLDCPEFYADRKSTPVVQYNAEAVLEDLSFAPVEESKPAATEFIPSQYQQAIFDAGRNGCGNIVVNATAGSGKTRTIQEFIKRYIPSTESWIYLVFNKRNQVEAEEKFGGLSNGTVATFHSFCLQALKSSIGKTKIDDKKVYQMLSYCSNREQEKELWPLVAKVVGLVKNTLTDVNKYDDLISMCDHYGVEMNGSASRVLELARDVVMQCRSTTAVIDFDDMIWLPVIENMPMPKFDNVLVDETQDLNAVQIEIVLRIRKDGGKVIAIGDENQAIYGFRGADADAMDKVISALGATVLPLSLCYRNPKSVVNFVNTELPHIKHEALETAEEGLVETINESKLFEYVNPGDMVICRTNAPLIKPCFSLIQRGIKAIIVGRAIGEELVNLINRIAKRALSDNLEVVLGAMSEYAIQEVARLMKQQKESTAQALEDKVDTIYALADGCKTIKELTDKAQSIFSDDVKGVVFSSAHRAKGLEADRVFILRYDLMPHPMAKQAWQLKQEINCKFVALTRARKELYFVQEESK